MTYWTTPERDDDPLLLLGQAVQRARERASLSQRGLQAKTGVHQSAISRMERGVTPGMALEKFARVAMVLAEHLLVNDPVVPEHRSGPPIPAFWLALTQPPRETPGGDAASQFAEVGARALASLVDAADEGDGKAGEEDADDARSADDLSGLDD